MLQIVYYHWDWVTHICVSKLYHHWFRWWLMPSHYLNQCWDIVNWALRNKYQWNFKRNSCKYIFVQQNAFENVIWKNAAILSRPQYVNVWIWIFSHPKTNVLVQHISVDKTRSIYLLRGLWYGTKSRHTHHLSICCIGARYLNRWWLDYWGIHTSLGLSEFSRECNYLFMP